MTVLLVGCGYWGQNWAKTLARLGELAAICESALPLQAKIKEDYPNIALYGDISEALQHPGLEAVVIAAPVLSHAPLAQACLEANKSVLVEKPLTLDPIEAEALVSLAKSRGLTLAVGHLMMYQPALLKLQSLIREGALGNILSVQCTRVNLGKIRNEENVWWSLAPHDLSILSLLLEEPFYPVSASHMTPLSRRTIADSVYALFETASGKSASVHVSWLSHEKRHETVVLGSQKIAIFEDTLPQAQKLQILDYHLERQGDVLGHVQRGQIHPVDCGALDEDLLTMEAKAFLNAVRNGNPLQNDGQNGLQVTRMLASVETLLNQQPSVSSCNTLPPMPSMSV